MDKAALRMAIFSIAAIPLGAVVLVMTAGVLLMLWPFAPFITYLTEWAKLNPEND